RADSLIVSASAGRYSMSLTIFRFFFFSSRRRHTRSDRDWSSDVCSSDLCCTHSSSESCSRRRPVKRKRAARLGSPLYFFDFLCLVCLLAAPAAGAQIQAPSVYAITHAKIFTLAGSPIEDGTLVIRDGKIAAVGAAVEVPAGARVIDAKGLEVYPGLFDAVTQIGLSEVGAVGATVDATEAGNYNPDVVAATAISPSSEHLPVTRASGITEVLAVPASGGFDFGGSRGTLGGQASAIHLAGWTIDEMLIRKSAAMVVNWPQIQTQTFDFATFSRKEKPYSEAKQEYDKQVNELTDWIDRARHYAQAMEKGAVSKYDRDLKLEALAPVVRGELPVLVFANRARDIRNAVEFCDKQKLKMILAGGAEAYKEIGRASCRERG